MSCKQESYKRLGDYIREVDVRNSDLKCSNLLGLSIAKIFIPSIANTVGTDFRPYKIVKHNQFAYVPVTSRNGDKITIALYNGQEDCIISQAYTSFEIKNTKELLPEYLMMWFRRSEFDRYARFKSHGSAREVFDWDEMCNVMLPIPNPAEQQRIVDQYNAIQYRIENNKKTIAKLEETAQAIYRKMFVDDIDPENLPDGWRMGTLGEYSKVKSGFAFKSGWWKKEGTPVIKIGSISDHTIKIKNCDFVDNTKVEYAKDSCAKFGDIVIAMTGATIGKIAINYNKESILVNQRVGLFNLGNEPIKKVPFLYLTLLRDLVQNEIKSVGGDSAQANISGNDIEKIEIILPKETIIEEFNQKTKLLFELTSHIWNENEKLTEMLSLMMAEY